MPLLAAVAVVLVFEVAVPFASTVLDIARRRTSLALVDARRRRRPSLVFLDVR